MGQKPEPEAPPFRVLPELTPANESFWKGGATGELRMLHCAACDSYVHPPGPRCPRCLGKELAPKALSGRGVVLSVTVNHQQWAPGPHPYAIAIVELEEQPGLRLMTNVVSCAPEAVRIGMSVRVTFEAHGEVFVPLFEPAEA